MMQGHLNEMEIQQWAFEPQGCDEAIYTHIRDCVDCRKKAEVYGMLFSGIQQQPKPVFDFDVSQLVLAHLTTKSRKRETRLSFFTIYASIVGVLLAFGGYLYRLQLNQLLKKYVFNISSGVSTFGMYLLLTTAATLLVFQTLELFKRYHRKIRDINFY